MYKIIKIYNFLLFCNVEIELLIFSIVDPQYVCQAETSISHYFKEDKLTNYTIKEVEQTELIIINKNSINQVKEHYSLRRIGRRL